MNKKNNTLIIVIVIIACTICMSCCCCSSVIMFGGDSKDEDKQVSSSTSEIEKSTEGASDPTEGETAETTAKTEDTTTQGTETTELATENTYDNNKYYDVVEKASFRNSIGYTIVVHKVLAKKDVTASATAIAYDADGNVIGKSTSEIVLTNGEYNYFRYSFDNDISNAQLELSVDTKTDSILFTGERKAVEMTQYNHSGDDLYITFKQTGSNVSSFSKFKILFYQGDQIVDTEEGYFSIYAPNLNGKDSTEVASIWVYGKNFDRIECFYEP